MALVPGHERVFRVPVFLLASRTYECLPGLAASEIAATSYEAAE